MEIDIKVDVREVDGTEEKGLDRLKATVSSHWNDDDLAVIKFGNGPEYTVDADELSKALNRVTGWR